MSEITEKQLRKIRHILFEAMDKKVIESSHHEDVKEIQDHTLINGIVKYIGLTPTDSLTRQLKAEYKTWKQQLSTKVKELREHEKKTDTNI